MTMFAKIGALITSGFGLITAGKWLNKVRKILGLIRNFFKEGKETYKELKDVKPAVIRASIAFKTIRTQNETERELTYGLMGKAFEETLEFIDEAEDVWELMKQLKEIIGEKK